MERTGSRPAAKPFLMDICTEPCVLSPGRNSLMTSIGTVRCHALLGTTKYMAKTKTRFSLSSHDRHYSTDNHTNFKLIYADSALPALLN